MRARQILLATLAWTLKTSAYITGVSQWVTYSFVYVDRGGTTAWVVCFTLKCRCFRAVQKTNSNAINQVKNQKYRYVFLRTKHTTVCPAFSTKTSTWSPLRGPRIALCTACRSTNSSPLLYYQWWKANHSAPSIHYFAIAARLVALVQASSASVERVFVQVKLICDPMGVFERCNCNDNSILSR